MTTINVNQVSTFSVDALLKVMECAECGISFAIPERMLAEAKRLGEFKIVWCCPHGHQRGYGHNPIRQAQDEATRLRAEADRERAWRRDAERQTETERRSHSATKGQLTKTKKRVAGGACPCCNRSFVDLGRHMKGQHPHYAEVATSDGTASESRQRMNALPRARTNDRTPTNA